MQIEYEDQNICTYRFPVCPVNHLRKARCAAMHRAFYQKNLCKQFVKKVAKTAQKSGLVKGLFPLHLVK